MSGDKVVNLTTKAHRATEIAIRQTESQGPTTVKRQEVMLFLLLLLQKTNVVGRFLTFGKQKAVTAHSTVH